MKYRLFLDETGDQGLRFIDKNFPLFLLCGCLISESALRAITRDVDAFKVKYFGTTEVILVSRQIRRCEGPFQILFDLEIKKNFYEDLNRIFHDGDYCLISSGIQKEKHIKEYGMSAADPYSLSLKFILERVPLRLRRLAGTAKLDIVAEQRGKKEDRRLLAHFHSIRDGGSRFITPDYFQAVMEGMSFHHKSENIVGLQIADLCAYPLARHILNPKEPSKAFQIIETKIDCRPNGDYSSWGLKIFP